jgi:hypothetical protein
MTLKKILFYRALSCVTPPSLNLKMSVGCPQPMKKV